MSNTRNIRQHMVYVVDTSNSASPLVLAQIDTEEISEVAVSFDGDQLYVALKNADIVIFDTSNPNEPKKTGVLAVPEGTFEIALDNANERLYLITRDPVARDSELWVVDVSNAAIPVVLNRFRDADLYDVETLDSGLLSNTSALSVSPDSNRLYLVGSFGVAQVDVQNLSAAMAVSLARSPDQGLNFYRELRVSPDNRWLYCINNTNVFVFDALAKGLVGETTQLELPTDVTDLALSPDGSRLYAAGGRRINSIDVSNPAIPGPVVAYTQPATVVDMDISGTGVLFTANRADGLFVLPINRVE